MSQDNQITLRGYLTADPRYRQTNQTGTPMTEFRVGSTPRRLNRETGEWVEMPTSYYNIKCWRRLAINAVGSLHKGDQVVIRGKFYTRSWVDGQQRPRTTLEIEADSLGHDLAYGWSHFMRGSRPQAGAHPGGDAGELARDGLEAAESGDGAEFPGGQGWEQAADPAPAGGGNGGDDGDGGDGQSSPHGTGEGGADGESREAAEGYEGHEDGTAGRLAGGEENLSGLGPAAGSFGPSDDAELLVTAAGR